MGFVCVVVAARFVLPSNSYYNSVKPIAQVFCVLWRREEMQSGSVSRQFVAAISHSTPAHWMIQISIAQSEQRLVASLIFIALDMRATSQIVLANWLRPPPLWPPSPSATMPSVSACLRGVRAFVRKRDSVFLCFGWCVLSRLPSRGVCIHTKFVCNIFPRRVASWHNFGAAFVFFVCVGFRVARIVRNVSNVSCLSFT